MARFERYIERANGRRGAYQTLSLSLALSARIRMGTERAQRGRTTTRVSLVCLLSVLSISPVAQRARALAFPPQQRLCAHRTQQDCGPRGYTPARDVFFKTRVDDILPTAWTNVTRTPPQYRFYHVIDQSRRITISID